MQNEYPPPIALLPLSAAPRGIGRLVGRRVHFTASPESPQEEQQPRPGSCDYLSYKSICPSISRDEYRLIITVGLS